MVNLFFLLMASFATVGYTKSAWAGIAVFSALCVLMPYPPHKSLPTPPV